MLLKFVYNLLKLLSYEASTPSNSNLRNIFWRVKLSTFLETVMHQISHKQQVRYSFSVLVPNHSKREFLNSM